MCQALTLHSNLMKQMLTLFFRCKNQGAAKFCSFCPASQSQYVAGLRLTQVFPIPNPSRCWPAILKHSRRGLAKARGRLTKITCPNAFRGFPYTTPHLAPDVGIREEQNYSDIISYKLALCRLCIVFFSSDFHDFLLLFCIENILPL